MKRLIRRFLAGLMGLVACFSAYPASSFTLASSRWEQPAIDFFVFIPFVGDEFNNAFGEAIDQWNAATSFVLTKVADAADPCRDALPGIPSENGASVRGNVCDEMEFGATVLAVTRTFSTNGRRLQSGIMFNGDVFFDIHAGPPVSNPTDFRRVAIHELGHVIGLEHSTATAIMEAEIGAVETPQQDDMDGVAALFLAPANGTLATAAALTGWPRVSGSSFNAAKETGEPNHAGESGGHSIWWSWTAPKSGLAVINTVGSAFDTVLGVYTGESVAALNPIASNDDEVPAVTTSRLVFAATSGQVYKIAVDGFEGGMGPVSLSISAAPGNDLVVDLGGGLGVWSYLNDSTWEKINSANPAHILVADLDGNGQDDVIADFGGSFGLWIRRNNGAWTQFNALSAVHLAAADLDNNGMADVIADFGAAFGTWVKMNDLTWSKFNTNTTGGIAVGDLDGNGVDDVMLDLGAGVGLWAKFNDATWEQINVNSPKAMMAADLDGNGMDEVILDLGSNGIWIKRNNATWEQISSLTSSAWAAGDLDGNGQQDLAADLGSGIRLYRNDGGFVSITPALDTASADSMVTADLDLNGKDELILDLGPGNGIDAWRNDASITAININSAVSLSAGNLDGE